MFIDYGNNYAAKNSLRGIRNHRFVSYLEDPGKVDITADVDFHTLRKVVENSKSDLVHYHGPIPQVWVDGSVHCRATSCVDWELRNV